MKSLSRTVIMLVVINLTIGNFALAQNAFNEGTAESTEPVRRSRVLAPRQPGAAHPAPLPEPLPEPYPEPEPVPTPIAPPRILTISGRIGLSGGEVITGLSGVEIQGLPGNPVTDENGFYSATVPYGFSGSVRPVKKGYFFQPNIKSYNNITENLYKCFTAIRIGPPPMFARTGSRKVLVIPATDVKAEDLTAITEDLQVMSHIFDDRFIDSQEAKEVFVDFGDIFGRDSRSTEAIYMQGYGVLFLMEVNFAFSPAPEAKEEQAEETKDVDPIWQRAKRKLFSPPGFRGGDFAPEEQYSAQQIDLLKTELIRTLKHTANIRVLNPDEWIILTVIGQSRQPGEFYEDYFRITAPRPLSKSRRSGRSSRSSSSSGGGMGGMGGGMMGGGIGGGVMMGGGMGGMAGGGMGGGGFGGGVMMGGGMGGMMGGMAYGEMGSPSTTVLTIRAKKLHVDTFAIGELDFEQFQHKVEIFTY